MVSCVDSYTLLQAFIMSKIMFLFGGTDKEIYHTRLVIWNARFDQLWINYINVLSLCKKAKDLSSEELVSPSQSRWASLLNTNHLELGHRGFIQIYKGIGDELGPYSHVVIQTGHGETLSSSSGQSLYTQLLKSILNKQVKVTMIFSIWKAAKTLTFYIIIYIFPHIKSFPTCCYSLLCWKGGIDFNSTAKTSPEQVK